MHIRWTGSGLVPPPAAADAGSGQHRLGRIEVLFLCTGNICRSPAAEALLRHRLTAAGIDAHVHSAGLLSGGQPASTHGVDLLHERGIDLSAHRSRGINPELLRGADLIIAMAREHVREAVVRAPDVFARTFTLKELVRRGEEVGPRLADQPMYRWLSYVHAGRTSRELLGTSTEDDVADPIGRPRAEYERMIAELDRLLDRAFALIWGAEARQRRTEQERAS